MKKIIATLLLLLGISLGIYFYFSKPALDEIVLYGNVDQRQIELSFMDAGRVTEILVEEGEEVVDGQLLARLETRRLRDKIAVAEAQMNSAELALAKLKNGTRPEEIEKIKAALTSAQAEVAFSLASYERYSEVYKNSGGQAISLQDLDRYFLQLEVARARLLEGEKTLHLAEIGPRKEDIAGAEVRVKEALKNLESLQNNLDDAELRSPLKSVVNRRFLEPGDMASPQRAVFSLAVLSPKWVRAYVGERELGLIKPNMKAEIYIDSHPNDAISGRLGFISSTAEFTPKSVESAEIRTSLVYEVRIYVEDERNILRLGMPATVRFPKINNDS